MRGHNDWLILCDERTDAARCYGPKRVDHAYPCTLLTTFYGMRRLVHALKLGSTAADRVGGIPAVAFINFVAKACDKTCSCPASHHAAVCLDQRHAVSVVKKQQDMHIRMRSFASLKLLRSFEYDWYSKPMTTALHIMSEHDRTCYVICYV